MANTVIGFFDDAQDARRAVDALQESGISASNIDLAQGGAGSSYAGTTNDGSSYGDDKRDDGNAITRFFNSLFGDDSDDARRYSKAGANSNYIVTVHTSSSDESEDVADILDDYGAVDVDERAASGGGRTATSESRYNMSDDSTADRFESTTSSDSESINRVEEDLNVGKREVETGRVRLRSRIVETPVEEHVRLRQEHVNIERTPVDRRVSSDDVDNFQERDIELTERAEVPVVNKEARVVEEIRLNKEVDEKDEVIRDTVRKTDVDIDEDRTNRKSTDRYDDDDLTGNSRRSL